VKFASVNGVKVGISPTLFCEAHSSSNACHRMIQHEDPASVDCNGVVMSPHVEIIRGISNAKSSSLVFLLCSCVHKLCPHLVL